MKTLSLFILLTLTAALTAHSQGNLQYNEAKIISSTPTTIPAGKVWKVTAIYGHANNVCYFLPSRSSSASYLVSKGRVSGFNINGTDVISSAIRTDGNLFQFTDCTGGTSSYSNVDSKDNWSSDPNFFPMWLPAGTVVNTLGSTIFLSVVEFNIIP